MAKIPINSNVVSGVVVTGKGEEAQLLLLKRSAEQYWCQVAGKVEHGELAWQAILRELREETGISATELYTADYLEQFYEPLGNQIMVVPVFVILLSDVPLVRLNHEHTDYGWFSFSEAKDRVPFPNQHQMLDHVWQHFVLQSPSPQMRIDTTPQTLHA